MHVHDEAEPIPGAHRAPDRTDAAGPDVSRAIADPGAAAPGTLIELQRLAGNASVSRLIAGEDDEAGAPAQRSPVLDVVGRGGGSPLPDELRAEMEDRLGGDFSSVRVHHDAAASESARAVDAHAYTVGEDVVFRSDRWSPETPAGKRTLAHELTHVLQQRAGPVDGTETGDGIRLSHPADDFERAADRTAESAMAAVGDAAPVGASAGSGAPAAQRQAEEEEPEEEAEAVQALSAQRQTEDEEEVEEEPEELG